MINEIDVGDTVTIYVTFKDSAGVQIEPLAVTLFIREPNGTLQQITTFDHVGGSGHYESELTVTQPGRWNIRWLGTGGPIVSEAAQSTIIVYPDRTV